MTKKVLKEKYSEWNKNISSLGQKQNEIWHELQKLNAEKGDGINWCSMNKIVEGLIKAGLTHQTITLISEYYEIEGQHKALQNLAIATNNFEI